MKTLDTLKRLYSQAKVEYYSGSSSMTDAEFDSLEDQIRSLDPEWAELKKTGVRVGKKSKIDLQSPCPSLDKIVAEPALNRWIQKVSKLHPDILVSAKLDGSSVQSVYLRGKLTALYTRGDGVTGKDISYFIPHVNLPQEIDTDHPKLVLRHEAIFDESVYLKRWQGVSDTSRALASSVLNRQDVHPCMRDLQFPVLKVQFPVMDVVSGMRYCKSLGLGIPISKVVPLSSANYEYFSTLLSRIREKSPYSVDGIVLHTCSPRSGDITDTPDRPDWAKAFKVNDESGAMETTVREIRWQVSSFGFIVPKAIVDPVVIGGATIKQVAVHNARWAMDRGLGVGAQVLILRSGDIIPKVIRVLSPKKMSLPKKSDIGDYEWDESGTNLVLSSPEESDTVLRQKFTRFFSKLGLDGVSSALAEKLVAAGYRHTSQLPKLTREDFSLLPGVKSSATNMADQMSRVREGEFELYKLMDASCVFDRGVGSTRLRRLYSVLPAAFREGKWSESLEKEIVSTEGPVFTRKFREGLPEFFSWLRDSGVSVRADTTKKTVNGVLSGRAFSWTGYRSKDEETLIQNLGGSVIPFGSKTDRLFYVSGGKSSTKVSKAGDRAVQFAEFKRELKIK